MRVIILTSSLQGTASTFLPRLAETPGIEIALIVLSEGQTVNAARQRERVRKKLWRIGPLGALNGLRMREWYGADVRNILQPEPLDVLAARYGLRLERTPTVNHPRTIALFKEAQADLGLSLGNGYIGKKVYSVPRFGMVNSHGEILPEFQGAQSVIWQIYHGSTHTGYTIHQIDRRIDTGAILYQEKIPLEFKPTLRETVSHNCARIGNAASHGMTHVVLNYETLAAQARPQTGGQTYTTPSFWQYLRMARQHRRLYQAQQVEKRS